MRKGQILDQASQDASNAEVSQIFNEIGDSLNAGDVQFSPAMAQQMQPMTMEAAPVVEPPPAPTPKPRARKTTATVTGGKAAKAPVKAPAKRTAKAKTGTVS